MSRGKATTTSLFGIDAHKLIQEDLETQFPGTLTEYSIEGGRVDAILPPNQAYEIKPVGGTVPPERQLDTYLNATNGIAGFPNGLVRGTIFIERRIDGPYGLTDIFYYTSRAGVIEYEAFPSIKLLVGAIAFVTLFNSAQTFIGLGSTLILNGLSPVVI